jgi:dTDP-4-dehydrorhamnose 3,5-epimerase
MMVVTATGAAVADVGEPVRLVGKLAAGGRIHPLTTHHDDRGALTEIFRYEWPSELAPVQWNCVVSEPGVMRGVHIHLGYWEYYVVLHGRTTIGFRDVRRGSPTEGQTGLVELAGARLCALITPPGVAHGIYFDEPSTLLVGTAAYWNTTTELGCHWADPALEIPWPMASARLSDRDAALPSLGELSAVLPRWVPTTR